MILYLWRWLTVKWNYWTTRDGRKIRVDKLTDDHLVNILRMLKRQANSFQIPAGLDWRDFAHKSLKALEAEALKRGIEWE